MSGFGAPASNFGFGSAPQAANPANTQTTSGFSFAAPKTTAAAPLFGSSIQPVTTIASIPVSFGALAQPSTGPNSSFGFGIQQPATAATAPTFNFPTNIQPTAALASTATPATTAFSFAPPPAAAAAATTKAPATTTFSFGTLPTLGATATSSVAPSATTSSFPLLSSLGTGGTSFSLNKPPSTTASLNFNTTTTSATPFTGLSNASGMGLLAKQTPGTGTLSFNTTAPAPTPFVGLGGVDATATQPKPGESKQDNVKVKETLVPDEIAKTVDALKLYIKNQKTLSSDIGRASTSKLSNASGAIVNLQWSLQEIANCVEANYNHIKLLRKETSKAIQSVEMAQRTQDTPAGLQFENAAPSLFFQSLVHKYEMDLINFRQQIALTEKHMQSLTSPQAITPDDLKRGFQQINESFISLAGRLHEIHQKVEAQKEQFLNLRKYRLRDATNVFAKLDSTEVTVNSAKITSGPTPFSSIGGMSSFGKSLSNTGGGSNTATANQTGK